MKADGGHIFIRRSQPGAQVHQRTESRQHRYRIVRKQGQQLLRAAEKAHVPGHGNDEPPVFPVVFDAVPDGFRGDGLQPGLTGGQHRIQHPFCPDDAVRLGKSLPDLQGLGAAAAGTDADERDFRSISAAEPPAENGQGFL